MSTSASRFTGSVPARPGGGTDGKVRPVISREEYDRKVPHGYAGKGRPMDPTAPGVWWMELDDRTGGTVLLFGKLADSITCDSCGREPEAHGDSDAGPMSVCPA